MPSPTVPRGRRRGSRDRSRRLVFLRSVAYAFLLSLLLTGCHLPRWPVEGPLVSPFGVRFRGLLPSLHRGVDILVPDGTPVHAMSRGRVRYAGAMSGYGKVVWLEHGGGILTVYGHLSSIRVRAGQVVGGGDVLGLSGHSGRASGPHLHFEVWRHGREVDPVPLLGRFPSL